MNSIFKRKKTPEQLVKLLEEALNNCPPHPVVGSTLQSLPCIDTSQLKEQTTNTILTSPISTPAEKPSTRGGQDTTSNEVASYQSGQVEITRRLSQIKVMLYGEAEQESNPQKCAQLAELLIKAQSIIRLITNLGDLSFEARKHVAQIFNNLMRRDLGGFVSYIESNPKLMVLLLQGYSFSDISLNCGTMLRESLRHECLAKIVLDSPEIWKFFDVYVHFPNFDVASDAFASLKDLLTRHKSLSAQFFEANFDVVFEKYNRLLASDNYVTRRQSLKLLGEILLDRANFNIMMKYISRRENLKMMMNLLRDKSANIQFEAFHVLKVFVANPKKPEDITQILITNKDKLISYLKNFQNDKEDEQFSEEKALLIRTLENLGAEKVENNA